MHGRQQVTDIQAAFQVFSQEPHSTSPLGILTSRWKTCAEGSVRGRPSVDSAPVPITRESGSRSTLTSQMQVQGAWQHPDRGWAEGRLVVQASEGPGWA